jgi:hypothetical protein
MVKVNSLLTQRLKMATEKFSKMTNLAELSSSGSLSSFAGVFRVSGLNEKEKDILHTLLTQYSAEEHDIKGDLQSLIDITSEVKAINNQAAILHGERIKKAQDILKNYQDGAFSAWLVAIYGNRQTPYNFLQYYELYTALPNILHPKLDEMPRQAVYTLASRSGPLEKKEEIVKNYSGQPKQELLALIRSAFPLEKDDKRAQDLAHFAIQSLTRLQLHINHPHYRPSEKQKKAILTLLDSLRSLTEHEL